MYKEKFLVAPMLGKLAKWLRIWGYDAEFIRRSSAKDIVYRSLQEQRTVLTRDRMLSKKRAWKLVLIRDDKLKKQLRQLVAELGIKPDEKLLFSRCTICNVTVKKLDKESVRDRVPPFIYETHNSFSSCPKCNRIYWPGTHVELLQQKLKEILKENADH